MKLNVIVLQVHREAFTQELVAVAHPSSSNHNFMDINCYLDRAVFIAKHAQKTAETISSCCGIVC